MTRKRAGPGMPPSVLGGMPRLLDGRRLRLGRGFGFSRFGLFGLEQIPDALESLDNCWRGRCVFELRPQARDPDPQVLQVVAVFRAPDLRQELGVEHYFAGVRGEMLQQKPLGTCERDRFAALL